jgi:hypothetical protein
MTEKREPTKRENLNEGEKGTFGTGKDKPKTNITQVQPPPPPKPKNKK